MVDHPKKPFTLAAEPQQEGKERSTADKQQESQKNIRDKTNVDLTIKPPSFAPYSQRNNAPRGAVGIQRDLPGQQIPIPKQSEIDITKGDPEKGLFIDGKITNMEGYRFILKTDDLPSERGIEGGKIAKLDLRKDGKTVAHYNRGWEMKPKTSRDEEAVRELQRVFGGKTREFKPIVPKSHDKDHGHER